MKTESVPAEAGKAGEKRMANGGKKEGGAQGWNIAAQGKKAEGKNPWDTSISKWRKKEARPVCRAPCSRQGQGRRKGTENRNACPLRKTTPVTDLRRHDKKSVRHDTGGRRGGTI